MTKSSSSKGRLVWNHSTHIDGLIPVLEKLSETEGIQTVTPGRLSSAKSNIPHLKLRVSVPIRGGYKVVARNGKAVQEVFLVTTLTQKELEGAIAKLLS
ncbi:MAG: metal-binding protein [Okeania sp. SIO2H7]|nr:metal-binding protein [Okeania sp. SIO2H7]